MKHLRRIKTITSLSLIILLLWLPFLSEARVSIVYANIPSANEAAFDFTVQINQVDLSTDGRVLRYQGQAEPNTWVKLILKNEKTEEMINLGQVQTDQEGQWQLIYRSTQPLVGGDYTIQASSSLTAEQESEPFGQSLLIRVFYLSVLGIFVILGTVIFLVAPKLRTFQKLRKQEGCRPFQNRLKPQRAPPMSKSKNMLPGCFLLSLFIFSTPFTNSFKQINTKTTFFNQAKSNQNGHGFCVRQAKLSLDKGGNSVRLDNNGAVIKTGTIHQFEQNCLSMVAYSGLESYSGQSYERNCLLGFMSQIHENNNHLFLAISLMEKPEEFIQLLKDLFSPQELEGLVKRFEITVLLAKGYSYDQIKEKVGVSGGTVAKVSAGFNKNFRGYKVSLERVTGEKNA